MTVRFATGASLALLEELCSDDDSLELATELDASELKTAELDSSELEAIELLVIIISEELLLESTELDATELLDSTELLAELPTLLLASLEVEPLQIAPVTCGRCAGLPAAPLFPWTPNSMVCPGLMLSFQPTPVAV